MGSALNLVAPSVAFEQSRRAFVVGVHDAEDYRRRQSTILEQLRRWPERPDTDSASPWSRARPRRELRQKRCFTRFVNKIETLRKIDQKGPALRWSG